MPKETDVDRLSMRHYLKIILIITYVLINHEVYIDRFGDLGLTFSSVVYTVFFIFILMAVFMVSNIKNIIIRYICGLLLFSSAILFDAYQSITSDFLTYNAFIGLVNAQGFAAEAFHQYFYSIVKSTLAAALLLIGIVLKPKPTLFLPEISYILFPSGVLILLTVTLFIRGGDGAKSLPPFFTALTYSNLMLYEAIFNANDEKQGITIGRARSDLKKDVVLIIDESISAGYLDINSIDGVTTNLNNDYKNINIYNYGYAASITNCSYGTNLTIRHGGTRQNYLKMISTMPSIWEYAKKSEMHTVYIDAQRVNKRLNGIKESELKYIDEFIQFDNVAVVNRDMSVASELIRLINNNTSDFIIVNKIGAHFPVHDKFPDQFMFYKPVLSRGDYLDVSDTGSREGFSGSNDDWVLYRNSYRNTILWNVGNFFSRIIKEADLNKATIIYTSDHGQDLHETGSPGVNTHCSSNPVMEEGMVPLVVIEGNDVPALNWSKHLNKNINKSSHFNIFPTLLSIMHYEPEAIKAIYGYSLSEITNDELTFNSRFHARLGQKPVWKKIEPGKLREAQKGL